MAALKIYLADLTHTGNGVATEAFPLNIGLIASYANKLFGDQVDITLFKYPGDLQQAVQDAPPQILGCSNYTWNSNLSYHFCSMVKAIDANILTIFGGTNYPFDSEPQEKFLESRPDLDLHIYYEGEQAFARIIERVLGAPNYAVVLESSVAGCQFIDRKSGQFVSGPSLPRLQDLDDIPSPYVGGLLDKFFDGRLTPLVETARGCPFTCNFCNAYHSYFNKVNKFSDEYVREELHYIAKRSAKLGVGHVTFADNNFGMIPRDANTAEYLSGLQKQYGWPSSITAWTGKNAKERVIDVTKVLGETLSISMSVQSMDEIVLKNVGRNNIKVDHYQAIAEDLNHQGRPQHAEVIMPLPGESIKTHIDGLNKLLDTNVSKVMSHTLQVLHGTPYKDDEEYRRTHGYVTKYRIVPLDFSQVDDKYIFDVEEVGVATNTFSFEEYVEARKYLLVIDLCYSSGIFEPLKKHLNSRGIKNATWIEAIYRQIDRLAPDLAEVFDSFVSETRSELWDTEEELVSFYSSPENYEKLINYEMGGNVLFKHRVWILTKYSQQWVDSVFHNTERLVLAQATAAEESTVRRELDSVKDFVLCSVVDSFSFEKLGEPIEKTFFYDIPAWLKTAGPVALGEYGVSETIPLKFYVSSNTAAVMRDAFQTYGTDLAGLVKMVQRKAGLSLTRDVAYEDQPEDITVKESVQNTMYGPGKASL